MKIKSARGTVEFELGDGSYASLQLDFTGDVEMSMELHGYEMRTLGGVGSLSIMSIKHGAKVTIDMQNYNGDGPHFMTTRLHKASFVTVTAENQTDEHKHLHGPFSENQWKTCTRCNYSRHLCPGCGEWLYHGTEVCGPCGENDD